MPAPADRNGPSPRVDRPPGHRSVSEDARGTLVLIGGATTAKGRALQSFLELVDAHRGGRIVALTTASADPRRSARLWQNDFRAAGATRVDIPLFERGDAAHDREIAAMIGDARGVFLGGGDQVKLVSCLSGTRTCAAIKELFCNGGVVCGTSAGAAALSELTMAGGEIDDEGNIVEQYIGPGLGLLGFGAIIDTHFSQRRRLQRLFVVVGQNTQLLGLGIDEDTALIVRGHIGEVVGAGGVTFVDGRDTVHYTNAEELEHGRQLTLSHLRLGMVGSLHRLDLEVRDVVERAELGSAELRALAGQQGESE